MLSWPMLMLIPAQVKKEFDLELTPLDKLPKTSTMIFATSHKTYTDLTPSQIKSMFKEGTNPLLIDIRRIFDRKSIEEQGIKYWGL